MPINFKSLGSSYCFVHPLKDGVVAPTGEGHRWSFAHTFSSSKELSIVVLAGLYIASSAQRSKSMFSTSDPRILRSQLGLIACTRGDDQSFVFLQQNKRFGIMVQRVTKDN